METVIKKQAQITDMKQRNRTYVDKSMSWFQHKMYGIDGNGGVGGFTPEEADQLYGALNDLANRIRRAADSIKAPAGIAAV